MGQIGMRTLRYQFIWEMFRVCWFLCCSAFRACKLLSSNCLDHILTLQHSLAHYERMLSQSHPAYLSQLRTTAALTKGGTDKAIIYLTFVTIAVLCAQTLIGIHTIEFFSWNFQCNDCFQGPSLLTSLFHIHLFRITFLESWSRSAVWFFVVMLASLDGGGFRQNDGVDHSSKGLDWKGY